MRSTYGRLDPANLKKLRVPDPRFLKIFKKFHDPHDFPEFLINLWGVYIYIYTYHPALADKSEGGHDGLWGAGAERSNGSELITSIITTSSPPPSPCPPEPDFRYTNFWEKCVLSLNALTTFSKMLVLSLNA